MAIVQSAKQTGDITVEATSPGLAPATVTIAAKEAKLRPQLAPWERAVPKGAAAGERYMAAQMAHLDSEQGH